MHSCSDEAPPTARALRLRRRDWLRAAGAAGAVGATGAGQVLRADAQTAVPTQMPAALTVFPTTAAPFDPRGRRALAFDALNVLRYMYGLFPGKALYQLPTAPVLGTSDATQRAWFLTLPSGLLLYLLAYADVSGRDHEPPLVLVNNVPLLSTDALADYGYSGVQATQDGRIRSHKIMDLVFAPPAPGFYKIEVRGTDYKAQYELTIQAPDALGPALLRDGAGKSYATYGNQRRLVPDDDTAAYLGFTAQTTLSLSPAALAIIPEGPPLPALREGMLLRADGNGPTGPIVRLQRGARQWVRPTPPAQPTPDQPDASQAPAVQGMDRVVLQTIRPMLLDDTLVKGPGPDVFRASDGVLRKIPDEAWATQRGLSVSDALYVPDYVLATLPRATPEGEPRGLPWMDRAHFSETLGTTLPYRIFFPPRYFAVPAPDTGAAGQPQIAPPANAGATATTRHPVLYLLHGSSGRYDEWATYGLEKSANAIFAGGKYATPIVVCPQGGKGYWVNQVDGIRWSDYLVNDLVRHVDTTYRTLTQPENRAIGGLSMGGHAALQIPLSPLEPHNVFGVAGAHSPSLHGFDSAPGFFGDETQFAQRDPLTLAKTGQVTPPARLWIDTGTGDEYRPNVEALHGILEARKWPQEWHLYPGDHGAEYWTFHLPEYMTFYGVSFGQLPPSPLPLGATVALKGTQHIWIADEQGILHWAGDTRALAGHEVHWDIRYEVPAVLLWALPRGGPWLSAGLVKLADQVYFAKWESTEDRPRLLAIRSIADLELLGVNGANYNQLVLDQPTWEQRFGFPVDSLSRGTLESAAQ